MIRMRDRHIITWDDDGGIWAAAGVSYVISSGKKNHLKVWECLGLSEAAKDSAIENLKLIETKRLANKITNTMAMISVKVSIYDNAQFYIFLGETRLKGVRHAIVL